MKAKFLEVMLNEKNFENNLQLYMKTGYKTYEVMIEHDLDRFKWEYGQDVYYKFNKIYQTIKA